ncbi:MAG: hypothetical protein ACHBN1_26395 [Heteroscytonema crispum UTEX LB 1556]
MPNSQLYFLRCYDWLFSQVKPNNLSVETRKERVSTRVEIYLRMKMVQDIAIPFNL